MIILRSYADVVMARLSSLLGGVNRDLMKEFSQSFSVRVMRRILIKEHLCSVP